MKHRFLFTKLSTIAGLVTAAIGLLVLIGWQFDIAIFKTFFPERGQMIAHLFILRNI